MDRTLVLFQAVKTVLTSRQAVMKAPGFNNLAKNYYSKAQLTSEVMFSPEDMIFSISK